MKERIVPVKLKKPKWKNNHSPFDPNYNIIKKDNKAAYIYPDILFKTKNYERKN